MEYEHPSATDVNPETNGQLADEPSTDVPQWQTILDAPDYLTLLKGRKSSTAKEYEIKVQSVLKEALKFRLGAGTVTGLADVAAILAMGPDFAERAGILADADERAKKVLDMLTAPDNPWLMFAFAALPFIGQLFRNHEEQLKAVPGGIKKTRAERKAERAARPRPVIHIGKRAIKLPFRLSIHINFLRQNTYEPQILVNHVMNSDKVRKAIFDKYGVTIGAKSAN